MLEIQNVTKSYAKGSVKAVDDISLSVNQGEIVGFLGPNGAGKTTTIRMIMGMLAPDAGHIRIEGHDIRQDPIAAKSRLGFVPDGPEIYDRLTGLEYLRFMADMYGVPKAQAQAHIEQFLTLFDLTNAAGDLIRSYSRGMKQKLLVTAALIHNPPLWVLDEPMVGLDPRASHLLKQQIRAHAQAGNSVFFSTHVLEVAQQLCDRIAIIHRGRLVALGTMAQLQSAEHRQSLEEIFLEMTEQGEGEE